MAPLALRSLCLRAASCARGGRLALLIDDAGPCLHRQRSMLWLARLMRAIFARSMRKVITYGVRAGGATGTATDATKPGIWLRGASFVVALTGTDAASEYAACVTQGGDTHRHVIRQQLQTGVVRDSGLGRSPAFLCPSRRSGRRRASAGGTGATPRSEPVEPVPGVLLQTSDPRHVYGEE